MLFIASKAETKYFGFYEPAAFGWQVLISKSTSNKF
jgi:hypothetical protein